MLQNSIRIGAVLVWAVYDDRTNIAENKMKDTLKSVWLTVFTAVSMRDSESVIQSDTG